MVYKDEQSGDMRSESPCLLTSRSRARVQASMSTSVSSLGISGKGEIRSVAEDQCESDEDDEGLDTITWNGISDEGDSDRPREASPRKRQARLDLTLSVEGSVIPKVLVD